MKKFIAIMAAICCSATIDAACNSATLVTVSSNNLALNACGQPLDRLYVKPVMECGKVVNGTCGNPLYQLTSCAPVCDPCAPVCDPCAS